MKKRGIFFLFAVFLLIDTLALARVRIKDIAQVGGKRELELVGYGLVIGLDGTGDKSGTRPTVQSLGAMLKKMGIVVAPENLNVNNVAAVAVTARVPIFSLVGGKIDAMVSSIGNATSLTGGTLILTRLIGSDGRLYGSAQGKIQSRDGFGQKGAPKSLSTVGYIPGGVLLERDVSATVVNDDNSVLIQLNHPDFVTSERVMDAVKSAFETPVLARDPSRIRVQIPGEFKEDPIGFVARLESLLIQPDDVARVVINEQTGTVISGKNVKISAVSISHGSLEIRVNGRANVLLPESATVTNMVSLLTGMGASPWDIAVIFKALKKGGALKAELVLM